jgi:hypothetical protein
LVYETFIGETVNNIIGTLITKYTTGFTTANVNCPYTVDRVDFNFQKISDCLTELAERTGYDWYVDEYKDIHFIDGTATTAAPISVADDNGSYVVGSLSLADDISQIRNSVYLRGGEEIGSLQMYQKIADGTQNLFSPGYHFSAVPGVTVAGAPQTVGTEGIDNPAAFDCLWNPTEDYIVFAVAPGAGVAVVISGLPLNPIRLYYPDRASIAAYGEKQILINDNTIVTRAAARFRARAEMLQYAASVVSAKFVTTTKGFRAGQYVSINSALYSRSGSYIVSKTTVAMLTPTKFKYQIECISTKVFDIIDLFVKLLRERAKDQAGESNESYDPAEAIFEDPVVSESISARVGGVASTAETATLTEAGAPVTTIDLGTIFVAGMYLPSGVYREAKCDGSYMT